MNAWSSFLQVSVVCQVFLSTPTGSFASVVARFDKKKTMAPLAHARSRSSPSFRPAASAIVASQRLKASKHHSSCSDFRAKAINQQNAATLYILLRHCKPDRPRGRKQGILVLTNCRSHRLPPNRKAAANHKATAPSALATAVLEKLPPSTLA